jgi:hypothetical protein
MTGEEALAFVRQHGVVLASGKGPVPNVVEAIANESDQRQLVGTPAGPGDIQNPATTAGFTRDTRLSAS